MKRLSFPQKPIVIGERINPTGKSCLRKLYEENDIDYIIKRVLPRRMRGAHILDVNVGLPGN